ncbi:unnamed protein product, partial [Didymodactylos carnosus]
MFAASFLSATRDLNVALAFSGAGAYEADSSVQSVLFDINCNVLEPQIGVADIGHLSYNVDEREILFAPLHILTANSVDYDEQERVWRVQCSVNGEPDGIRIDLDQRLMELELSLRFLKSQSVETGADIEHNPRAEVDEESATFCAGVACILRELNFPKKSYVTLDLNLNRSSIPLFELNELRTFDEVCFLRHKPQIHAKIIAILYDCLGTIFKCKGRFQLALDYYSKAATLDEEDLRMALTRKLEVRKGYEDLRYRATNSNGPPANIVTNSFGALSTLAQAQLPSKHNLKRLVKHH